MRIFIYDRSHLIEIVEASDPKVAWRVAVTSVKSEARARVIYGGGGACAGHWPFGGRWIQTANRNGYEYGDFRAMPELANR